MLLLSLRKQTPLPWAEAVTTGCKSMRGEEEDDTNDDHAYLDHTDATQEKQIGA